MSVIDGRFEVQTQFSQSELSESDTCTPLIAQLAELSRRQQHSGEERRRHARFPTDDRAAISYLNPRQIGLSQVTVVDVSKQGLCLEVAEQLMPGSIIQVHLQGVIVMAEVRHCEPSRAQFHAGVEIQEIFP